MPLISLLPPLQRDLGCDILQSLWFGSLWTIPEWETGAMCPLDTVQSHVPCEVAIEIVSDETHLPPGTHNLG